MVLHREVCLTHGLFAAGIKGKGKLPKVIGSAASLREKLPAEAGMWKGNLK